MISLRHREKFRRALFYLAVSEGDVRDRLRKAYAQLDTLRDDEVPQEVRAEWASILEELTKRGPLIHADRVIKDALDHTLGRMKNKTARKIAERVYRIAIDFQ
jgi:hypothetical protein